MDRDAYLLELSRYIVLNPVRAGMIDAPEKWRWSSYRSMIALAPTPGWLAVNVVLSRFGTDREKARRRYRTFVLEGVGQGIWEGLRQQIYLGDEAFVKRMQTKARVRGDTLSVPRAQRRPPPPSLAELAAHPDGRNAAIVAAYATGAYTYREIAEHFGVHLATVGRIVRREMQRYEK